MTDAIGRMVDLRRNAEMALNRECSELVDTFERTSLRGPCV